MGGAVVIVLSFVLLVAALLLFILVELYYTLVLKSRLRLPTASRAPVPAVAAAEDSLPSDEISLSDPPPVSGDVPKLFPNSLYTPGVFGNPGFLFSIKEETLIEETLEDPSSFPSNLHFIGLLHPPKAAMNPTAEADLASPSLPVPGRMTASGCGDGEFVCISNPIYEVSVSISTDTTPFETPVSSPSKLDGLRGDESPPPHPPEAEAVVITPPLTPIKLPLMASSVRLADKSLLTSSCSDCSSSGSVCTSPSW